MRAQNSTNKWALICCSLICWVLGAHKLLSAPFSKITYGLCIVYIMLFLKYLYLLKNTGNYIYLLSSSRFKPCLIEVPMILLLCQWWWFPHAMWYRNSDAKLCLLTHDSTVLYLARIWSNLTSPVPGLVLTISLCITPCAIENFPVPPTIAHSPFWPVV